MDELELKGNSFKQKAQEAEESEETKAPIVKGNVKQKKKSAGKQFVENFVNEDANTIKTHVLFDIVVPALKDMVSNGFQTALDMLLYGSAQERNIVSSSRGRRISGQTNYNAISQQKNKRYSEGRSQVCDDIFFEERADAVSVLDELNDQIDKYGYVSCYDLYDAAGLSCDYTLKNWGWYDLSSANVIRTREGDYIISLPKPIVIK